MDNKINFVEIDYLHGKLKGLRPLSPGSVKRLSEDFMIDYTYHSNAIEGSTLTLDETARVLKDDITIAKKPLAHHLDAIGHRDAYYYVEDLVKNKVPFTERAIQAIHSLVLMGDGLNRGAYRGLPVRIGNFQPCQPYEVPLKMEQLLTEYDTEMQQLHVIERVAIFHLKFETIHPFIDGNGRVGRLILNFDLMKEGYPPVNIKYTDRDMYYDCFNHYRENNNDPTKMIELVAGYAVHELKRYIEMVEEAERLTKEQPEHFCSEYINRENGIEQ